MHFVDKYIERTKNSKKIYEEAKNYLPGGVSGSGKFMKPYPLYIKQTNGCKIIDVDNNEYIDMLLGQGVNVLGYRNEKINTAIKDVLNKYSMPFVSQKYELDLAKIIIRNMEPMEMVRFVNTGSESVSMCARAAMAYTQKDKIAKFEGHYHGQNDMFLVSGNNTKGPSKNPIAVKDCAGIPDSAVNNVIVLPFNRKKECISLIEKYGSDIAAVVLEPVTGFMTGCVPVEIDFLSSLRNITSEHNILLIYDEVVTGFRIALGGATEYFRVKPDMVSLGKIIGGGFPIGCYGGRKDIMEKVVTPTKDISDIKEKIFQSGTFTGNPVSMVAGITVLKEIEKGKVIPHINELGEYMRSNIQKIGKKLKAKIKVTGIASMFQIHFIDHDIKDKRDAIDADKGKDMEFSLGLINNGVYLPPSHPALISFAHSKKDMDIVLNTIEKVLSQIK